MYVFLGVAALVGLVAGLLLYGTSAILSSMFGLDVNPDDQAVRSVAEFRAQRRKKRRKIGLAVPTDSSTATSTTLVSGKGKGMWQERSLLSPSTILEEVDSDF